MEKSLAEIGRRGTYSEYAFFDKVRRLLGNETTYMNFMRHIKLYAEDILSDSDLISAIQPFTVKYPEIERDLREVFGVGGGRVEGVSDKVLSHRKNDQDDPDMNIDYASCRKHSASYRPLPDTYPQPACSGRTQLCDEVLNDIWVSFPLWTEDTTFGESKISAHQEFLYRCEDERFELDIVIDNITSTVTSLQALVDRMSRMTAEQARTYELDDRLGGSSEVLQRKAIQRIYGDKAVDMIEGMKKRPNVAVPIVVRRLNAKLSEWRTARENYNKIWRDLSDKQWSKHQVVEASTFKQNEARAIRTKVLINEAVTLYEENIALSAAARGSGWSGSELVDSRSRCMRRLEYTYNDCSVLQDAQALLVQGLCQLSEGGRGEVGVVRRVIGEFLTQVFRKVLHGSGCDDRTCFCSLEASATPIRPRPECVMYANSGWYILWRLYHRLCDRLIDMKRRSLNIDPSLISAFYPVTQKKKSQAGGGGVTSGQGKASVYTSSLSLIKDLLDGSVEMSSFETTMRKVYGSQAYTTFCIDRLVISVLKQLETVISDEVGCDILNLFYLSVGDQPFFSDDDDDADDYDIIMSPPHKKKKQQDDKHDNINDEEMITDDDKSSDKDDDDDDNGNRNDDDDDDEENDNGNNNDDSSMASSQEEVDNDDYIDNDDKSDNKSDYDNKSDVIDVKQSDDDDDDDDVTENISDKVHDDVKHDYDDINNDVLCLKQHDNDDGDLDRSESKKSDEKLDEDDVVGDVPNMQKKDTQKGTDINKGTLTQIDRDVEKPIDTITDISKQTGSETGKETRTDTKTDTSRDTETSIQSDRGMSKDSSKGTDTDTSKDSSTDTSKDISNETSKDISKQTSRDRNTETSKGTGKQTSRDTDTDMCKDKESRTDTSRDIESGISKETKEEILDKQEDKESDIEKQTETGMSMEQDKQADRDRDRQTEMEQGLQADKDKGEQEGKEKGKEADKQADKGKDKQMDKDSDGQTNKKQDMEIDKEKDIQQDKQGDKGTDRQTDTEKDMEVDMLTDMLQDKQGDKDSDKQTEKERNTDANSDTKEDTSKVTDRKTCRHTERKEKQSTKRKSEKDKKSNSAEKSKKKLEKGDTGQSKQELKSRRSLDKSDRSVGGVNNETAYRRRILELVQDEMCVRVLLQPYPSSNHTTVLMTMEILQVDISGSGQNVGHEPCDPTDVQKWSAYIDEYTDPEATPTDLLKQRPANTPIYLNRCLRRYCGTVNDDDDDDDVKSSVKKRRLSSMILTDDIGCQFRVGSYRMYFTASSSSVPYHTKSSDHASKDRRSRRRTEVNTVRKSRLAHWLNSRGHLESSDVTFSFTKVVPSTSTNSKQTVTKSRAGTASRK